MKVRPIKMSMKHSFREGGPGPQSQACGDRENENGICFGHGIGFDFRPVR